MEEKTEYLKRVYNTAVLRGLCATKKEFAQLLGVNDKALSSAMNGKEMYLTKSLLKKVELFASANGLDKTADPEDTPSVYVIPYEARGGTIGDFVDGIREYDCEKIISPIKGADYAMEVTGDSMSPEYPSGSRVLIKKVDATAFVQWNEVYVLDTPNGAVIKRVRKTDDPAVVECVSVNPAYQPYTIPRDFIRGWYKVLMVMSLK
jgi:phage repressor protein C with HTH and peptisase S24 domain